MTTRRVGSEIFTCGGCDNRWTGTSRCHCSAAGCHRTFAGLALFDRHRVDGACVEPETITREPKDGSEPERVMFLTDGIWQSVEEPATKGESLRLWRERKAAS
jgi:hypothetical protein